MPSAMPLQNRIAKILLALSICCWHPVLAISAKANGQEEMEGICSQ